MPVDDAGRFQVHPVFQDGGIDAAEVLIGNQVALLERLRAGFGVLAVHAAVHAGADGECHARRAVVGAGAVVPNPSAEFGEQEHHHIVIGVVLAQVVPEVGYRFGYVRP